MAISSQIVQPTKVNMTLCFLNSGKPLFFIEVFRIIFAKTFILKNEYV